MPSRKPLPAQNFFGKSYPRAIGALTGDDKLVVGDNRPQLPNAPFLSEFPSIFPTQQRRVRCAICPLGAPCVCVGTASVVPENTSPICGGAEWAGTADWRRGGTGSHWVGKVPKEPITPFDAYEMYLDSQAAKAVAEAAQQKDGNKQEPDGNKEVTVSHSAHCVSHAQAMTCGLTAPSNHSHNLAGGP